MVRWPAARMTTRLGSSGLMRLPGRCALYANASVDYERGWKQYERLAGRPLALPERLSKRDGC